jgi:signal transduction histidine kinase
MDRDLIAFVHSSYQEKATSIISNLINGILTGPTEFLAVRKDGSHFFAEANAQLLRDASNNPFGILFILRDITKRKQAEDAMVKLTALEERQRFARDLHDSVNQSIHGLVLLSETLVSTLEKNNTERAKQIAGRLQENARQVLKETRLMLYEMQPPETRLSANLIENLETRLLTVERHAGVRARIIQEGSMEYFPMAWYENIFWITIEALNNAIKYAQASDIQIVIRCFPQNLELEVIDNGIGFDPGKPHGGLGLQSMRERASLLGGELTITSTAGEGYRVRFRAEIREKS